MHAFAPIFPPAPDMTDGDGNEIDFSGMPYMAVDIASILDSDALYEDLPHAFRNFALCCVAFNQIPAGSLPNNDKRLMNLSKFQGSLDEFIAAKPFILRNFILHDDGRYYHKKVIAKVLEIWEGSKKVRDENSRRTRSATQAAAEKRKAERARKAAEQRSVAEAPSSTVQNEPKPQESAISSVTESVTDATETETYTDTKNPPYNPPMGDGKADLFGTEAVPETVVETVLQAPAPGKDRQRAKTGRMVKSKGFVLPEELQPKWAEFMAAYPDREPDNPQSNGRQAFFRCVEAGVDPDYLIRAAKLYNAYAVRNHKAGTEGIKHFSTFLSLENRPFDDIVRRSERLASNVHTLPVNRPVGGSTGYGGQTQPVHRGRGGQA